MKFKNDIQRNLYMIERGSDTAFEELRLLNKAANYEGRIPLSFWKEIAGGDDVLGLYMCRKADVVSKKEEVVASIFERLNNLEGAMPDNVYRLLHSLSILGIDKDDERLPKNPEENKNYAIAYYIWVSSEGEENKKTFRLREASMMRVSKTIKLLLDKLYEVTS